MTELLESVNQTLWGTGLVLLLLGTGAFCIVTDRMAAVRSLRHLGKTGRSGIHAQSPFQACMTALAAAMGTGNIAGVAAALTLGGAERTGRFAAVVMPVLTGVYLIAAGVVIVRFRFHIGEAIVEIFRSAFGWQQAAGGIAGAAIRQTVSVGVRRGVFSNEAGLGSSGMLHSEADCTDPRVLGGIGVLEVIADTFVCCTATALAVLTSGAMDSGADGAALVLAAFHKGLGNAADWILPPVIALFALCTLIGWSHCGASALRSIGGARFLTAYRILFCIFAVIGAVSEPGVVWTIADMANACMAYCNLPGILLLYPKYHK